MFWKITTSSIVATHLDDEEPVSLAGRVLSFRRSGGIAFGHLSDTDGRIQFALQKNLLGEEVYKAYWSVIKVGVHVGISGKMWTSKTGERTVMVEKFELLQDVWRGFPDKLHGITDPDQRLRKRYLDCVLNPEIKEVFRMRSRVIAFMRNYLAEREFMEVETPILQAQASGAMARPFVTRHNALESDMFLRIAPETYLKRAVAAGFDNVFEIGKNFRNEGSDPSHLQEFTSIEWYRAYAEAGDNLIFFSRMLMSMAAHLYGDGKSVNIDADLPSVFKMSCPGSVKYRQLFLDETGQNPEAFTADRADRIFKNQIRPKLVHAIFVEDYPAHLAPMAARKKDDPNTADMWQYICDGWEIVKCYTELTDPVLQRQLLNEQATARAAGDEEAMALEEDFLECMEYGMPPMSGLGMGIDRLVALMTGQTSLRDVVLFPTLLVR